MSGNIVKVRDRFCANIVRCGNVYYYVDTAYTFDAVWETMVFLYDEKEKAVADWTDRYVERYSTEKNALKRHDEICNNLEKYLSSYGEREDGESE